MSRESISGPGTVRHAIEAWTEQVGQAEVTATLRKAGNGNEAARTRLSEVLGASAASMAPKALLALVQTPRSPPTRPAPDTPRVDAAARERLMSHDNRVAQTTNARPPPQLTAKPGVVAFTDLQPVELAEGVEITRAVAMRSDPAVSIDHLRIAPDTTTPTYRLPVDQRCLVITEGTVELDGTQHPVRPGDMVFIPRGTPYRLEAAGASPLRVWSVTTPGWEGRGYDVAKPRRVRLDSPMRRQASVLQFDQSKEFFVGEGLFILERANSEDDPAAGFDRARVPRGVTTALHELSIDERYLVTKGNGIMDVGGQKLSVQAGDVVMIPKGTPQRITSGPGPGGEAVEFYCVTTPRFVVEDYVQHIEDATVDAALYDGSRGPIESLRQELRSDRTG